MRKIKEIISHGRRLSSRLQEIDGRGRLKARKKHLDRFQRFGFAEDIIASLFDAVFSSSLCGSPSYCCKNGPFHFSCPAGNSPAWVRAQYRLQSQQLSRSDTPFKSYVGIAICLHVH